MSDGAAAATTATTTKESDEQPPNTTALREVGSVLLASDGDENVDAYERPNGAVSLVSTTTQCQTPDRSNLGSMSADDHHEDDGNKIRVNYAADALQYGDGETYAWSVQDNRAPVTVFVRNQEEIYPNAVDESAAIHRILLQQRQEKRAQMQAQESDILPELHCLYNDSDDKDKMEKLLEEDDLSMVPRPKSSDYLHASISTDSVTSCVSRPGAYLCVPPPHDSTQNGVTLSHHPSSQTCGSPVDLNQPGDGLLITAAEVVDDQREAMLTQELQTAKVALERLQSTLGAAVEATQVVLEREERKVIHIQILSRLANVTLVVVVMIVALVIGLVLGRTGRPGTETAVGGAATPIPGISEQDHNLSRVFTDNSELHEAVRDYLENRRRDSKVAQQYGWPIGTWDVSQVQDFSLVCADEEFNEDISQWNVSRGINFAGMFQGAARFNRNISSWDVSRGQNFQAMFFEATSFNQDLSQWQVYNGIHFQYMFSRCSSFNQSISQWNVSSGIYFEGMFDNATIFNSDLDWDVSQGENFLAMFKHAKAFNQDISQWNVVKGRFFSEMFLGAERFNQNLCSWGVKLMGRDIAFSHVFRSTACPELSTRMQTGQVPQAFCHFCT